MLKMSFYWLVLAMSFAVAFPLACSGSAGEGDGGYGDADAESGGDWMDAGMDAQEGDVPVSDADGQVDGGDQSGGQGIGCFLTVSVMEMLGQKTALVAGGFYPETNIVPWDPESGLHGFEPDTCREPGTTTPECQVDTDCVHTGQVCIIDRDQSGNPIPDSGHCENPTGDPVDIGPVTVSGFSDGEHTLRYNAGQNGAYTIDGQGDGQVDPSMILPERDYGISGNGDQAQGLGAFNGSLFVPCLLSIIEPVPQQNQMGMLEITLDTQVDTVFKWTGSSNGYVRITINGKDSALECLARDDGEFTITAADMAGLVLNQYSFFNLVTLERNSYGTLSGPGLVNPQVSSMMNIIINVKPR